MNDDERLRALLHDAVAGVDPDPALERIRSRTKGTTMDTSTRRSWVLAAAGAVAATAATVVAVSVLSDGGDDDGREGGGPVASSPTATAEPTADPTPTPSQPADPTTERAVPVYYVGDTPAGPRLYREFHRLQVPDDREGLLEAALLEALGDTARDPDYRSPWASVGGVGLRDVTTEQDVLVVDLAGDLRDRPASLSEDEAAMAVEQLVHTVHAVVQDRVPVLLRLDGGPTDQLLGVPASEPLAAGDPMQVQATVWVTAPQDGDEVASPFTVEGRGAFFEATVSWQLLRDGAVVDEGFATAEEGMTLSPYSFEVEAEPGDYVLRVYDADMSGGEGNGEAEDTKRVTVR